MERPRPEQPGGLVFAHPDRRRLGQRPLPDYLQRVLQHLLDAAGNLLLVFFELAGMVATLIQLGMLLETVEPAEEAVEEAVECRPAGAALVVVRTGNRARSAAPPHASRTAGPHGASSLLRRRL